jgi:ABC-2 type transport system permease protein
MNAFTKHLFISLKLGLRDKSLLIDFYILPLAFYLIMGGVMSSINPDFKTHLVTSLVVFGVTMGALQGVSAPIAKLRESGTLRALRVLGVPSYAVLATEALGPFIHLFLSSSIILLTAPIFFKAQLPGNMPAFFALLALAIAATISVGLAFGLFFRTHMASMLSMVVSIVSVLLGGMMFPSSMLPQSFRYLSRLLPATFAVQAFSGLSFGAKTDFSAWASVLVLTLFIVIFSTASVIRFVAVNRESA